MPNPDPIEPSGVVGEDHHHAAAIDKSGRASLQVWRATSKLGKVEMLRYLDVYRGGFPGFAKDLKDCLSSEDDRVRLGALKFEAQLREWLEERAASVHVDVDARQVHVTAETMQGVFKAPEDQERLQAHFYRGAKNGRVDNAEGGRDE